MDRVEHPAMDRFRLRAAYEGGGLVNGFEYSLDAIVEDDFPMEAVTKTRMGQVMIQRCRKDVLNAEWEGYEMDLKAALEPLDLR